MGHKRLLQDSWSDQDQQVCLQVSCQVPAQQDYCQTVAEGAAARSQGYFRVCNWIKVGTGGCVSLRVLEWAGLFLDWSWARLQDHFNIHSQTKARGPTSVGRNWLVSQQDHSLKAAVRG